MSEPLVLGIGNLLMGDEGVGVHALAGLEGGPWPADVRIVDGGTGGFHLLGYLQDFDPIVMVDATMDGQPAGTVTVLRPQYASDFPRSLTAHDIGLRDLIEAAVLTGRLPDITLITVSIAEMKSMETRLSAEVEAALPQVRALIRACVAEVRELVRA